MQSKVSIVSGAMLLIAALLSGCGTTKVGEHPLLPPTAELGPQFELLKASSGTYQVSEAMDGAHRAHLIVASRATKDVRHVVVSPDGAVSSETIRDGVVTRSVDLAFDRQGNLHVLIDDEHLMKKGGKWVGDLRTPWKERGLYSYGPYNPYAFMFPGAKIFPRPGPGFVKGAPDLTWAFNLEGWEMALPKRSTIEISVAGPWLIPVPLPRKDQVSKLLVVPEETPYRHWHAVGMEDDLDVGDAEITADAGNNVQVRYVAHQHETPVGLRYASFRANAECPEMKPGRRKAARTSGGDTRAPGPALPDGMPVCQVRGSFLLSAAPSAFLESVSSSGFPPYLSPENVATDPESGAMLMAGEGVSSLVGDKTSSSEPETMPVKHVDVLVAPAGRNRFHALATATGTPFATSGFIHPVYYLEYSGGAWSAPVELGSAWRPPAVVQFLQLPFIWTPPQYTIVPKYDVPKIVADNNGRALLIWPTDDALVGRWVALK